MSIETKTCRTCGHSFEKPPRTSWRQWQARIACSASCAAVRPIGDAFWSRVAKAEGEACWEWTGAKNRKGYGNFRSRPAHVIAHELSVGAVIAGHQVDHLCRNRGCVNPAHLEAVTPDENRRRHLATVTHCKRGHELNGTNVRLIVRSDGTRRKCLLCDKIYKAEARKRRVSHVE